MRFEEFRSKYLYNSHRACLLSYLMDKISYVSWVGGSRAEGVLVVMMERPFIQTSDPHFDTFWLQGIWLLQLTQIVVLHTHTQSHTVTHWYYSKLTQANDIILWNPMSQFCLMGLFVMYSKSSDPQLIVRKFHQLCLMEKWKPIQDRHRNFQILRGLGAWLTWYADMMCQYSCWVWALIQWVFCGIP